MIIDVPTADDFSVAGTDFLNIAWEIVLKLSLDLEEHSEYWRNDDGEVKDKYWSAAQRPLSTALSLIQQGTELLLKGHIASVSPYLLISGDLSAKYNNNNKDECDVFDQAKANRAEKDNVSFTQFKTIDAQKLIQTYNLVKNKPLDKKFQDCFDKLKRQRNTIMHSVPCFSIQPKELIVAILEISEHLISPGNWIKIRKSFIGNSSSSLISGSETIQANFLNEIHHVIQLLEDSKANKYFGFDKKQKSYMCPSCHSKLHDSFPDDTLPKLAQLQLDEPSIYCFICEESTDVIRENCINRNCSGNILSAGDRLCLTCGSYPGSSGGLKVLYSR